MTWFCKMWLNFQNMNKYKIQILDKNMDNRSTINKMRREKLRKEYSGLWRQKREWKAGEKRERDGGKRNFIGACCAKEGQSPFLLPLIPNILNRKKYSTSWRKYATIKQLNDHRLMFAKSRPVTCNPCWTPWRGWWPAGWGLRPLWEPGAAVGRDRRVQVRRASAVFRFESAAWKIEE